jgi:hypothetical protein
MSPTAVASFHLTRNTGAGEKGEENRPASGQEFNPRQIGLEYGRPNGDSKDELCEGAHHDLGERGGDPQPNRDQRGYQRQT